MSGRFPGKLRATKRPDGASEISCSNNFFPCIGSFVHSLKNDVSADVFPAQLRFNSGDVLADITITLISLGRRKQ
jgi:hypothetical protein